MRFWYLTVSSLCVLVKSKSKSQSSSEDEDVAISDRCRRLGDKYGDAVSKMSSKSIGTIDAIVHRGTICDLCKMDPVIGIRYKCLDCFNYDLCSSCMKKERHNEKHKLMAIHTPWLVKKVRNWCCLCDIKYNVCEC